MPELSQLNCQIPQANRLQKFRQTKPSESRVALLVDQLVGEHQVVVKNLETNYRKVPDISAAIILGDGT